MNLKDRLPKSQYDTVNHNHDPLGAYSRDLLSTPPLDNEKGTE